MHDLSVVVARLLRKAGERDERRHRELGREQVGTVWTGLVHLFADTVTRIPGRVDAGCEPGCEPVGVFGGRCRMRYFGAGQVVWPDAGQQ